MSKFIFFRVNVSSISGIGHLSRSRSLAQSLRLLGIECCFIVDKEDSIYKNFLIDFKYIFLYNNNESFLDEKNDATRFKGVIKEFEIHGIILDDYRLSLDWERQFIDFKYPLIVLDDRDKVHHNCNMIIDAKWTGDTTILRYCKTVPKNCIRLLGPKYIILGHEYGKKNNTLNESKKLKNTLNILLNFGGGADLSIAEELLLMLLKKSPKEVKLSINVVIGPFALNKDKILSIANSNKMVKAIINANSLHENLKFTDLYIGASGGTLYEALSMNIPSITFSISENQNNELNDLEDFGHYFHLNNFSKDLFNDFTNLVRLILSDYNRIKQLYRKDKKIEVDGLGSRRIAKNIESLLLNKNSLSFQDYELNETIKNRVQLKQSLELVIEPIGDDHINKYLDARNLSSNLRNMTEVEKVNRLSHYIWWLNNERSSFILRKGEEPLLYIWHQLKTINGFQVLIGGWFLCNEACSPLEVIHALNWQLEFSNIHFPGVPWVAVINKTNKFVQLLNKRCGFKSLKENDMLFNITSECFPYATTSDFDYVFKQ